MTDAISPIQPSAGQGMPNFRTSFYDAGHVAMMRTRQFVTPSWRTVSAQLRHGGGSLALSRVFTQPVTIAHGAGRAGAALPVARCGLGDVAGRPWEASSTAQGPLGDRSADGRNDVPFAVNPSVITFDGSRRDPTSLADFSQRGQSVSV